MFSYFYNFVQLNTTIKQIKFNKVVNNKIYRPERKYYFGGVFYGN